MKEYDLEIPRKNKKKEILKYRCNKCGKFFTILNENGHCYNCEESIKKINGEQYSDSSDTGIHDKIINLRKQGLSYSKIAKKLNCAKSTVSYHCNQSTKDKVNEKVQRQKEEEPWKYKLLNALDNFKHREKGVGKAYCCKD